MARHDQDVDRDLAQWVDELTTRYQRQGLDAVEARRRALIDMEGLEQARERARDAREAGSLVHRTVVGMLISLRDVRRGLRTGKGALALALGVLTLTLAAGTVTFSVADAIALQPLPYGAPDRLVAITRLSDTVGHFAPSSPQDLFAWRDGVRSLTGLAGSKAGGGPVTLENASASEEANLIRVTTNLFEVLGVAPALGRSFTDADGRDGADDVLVIGDSIWKRAFAGDRQVIGRRVSVLGRQGRFTAEIIGVLPPDVTFPITAARPPEIFRPWVATPRDRDYTGSKGYDMYVVGRLAPGARIEQTRAEVEAVAASMRAAYPRHNSPVGTGVVMPLLDRVAGPVRSWLILLLAAVGGVALVGCVNVASLLLARATVRMPEFATRASLGASQAHLARALLFEGLVVTTVAAAAALLLAYWGVGVAKANLPADLARASDIGLDARVLIALVGAAIVSGSIAGGVPALRIGRADLFARMKSGGVIGGRAQARTLGAFLSAEVAVVTVLLVSTTLVVTTFVMLTTADLGVDRRNVITMWLSKPQADPAFFEEVIARARAVPGVTAVGMVPGGVAPLSGLSGMDTVRIPGVAMPGADMFHIKRISPTYFDAMGVRLLRGRPFDASDRAGSAPVVVISDVVARRYFPGRDAIGQTVTFWNLSARIVGIAQSVRLSGPEAEFVNELYVPLTQTAMRPVYGGTLVVRTAAPALAAAAAIRQAVSLPGVRVDAPQDLEDDFRHLTAGRRFNAQLMSIFGAMAVAIGAMGIYATMAFVVAQQTRTIGLRMALGASQAQVLRSVLRESLVRVGVGAVVGLLAARAIAGVFTSLVFGVATTSLAVYAGVAAGLIALGTLAALAPAVRAARVDPLTALRAE